MTNDEINTTLQKFKNISHNLLFQKKKKKLLQITILIKLKILNKNKKNK